DESGTVVCRGGHSPPSPAVEGLAGVESWWTEDATSAHQGPASLIVIGGGVAGSELAQLYRRLGSEVTILQHGERLMPRVDAEAGDAVKAAFEEDGIQVRLGVDVESVSHHPVSHTRVRLAGGEELTVERLLVAAGRKPNGEGLGLEDLGVRIERGAIAVDEHLRATENVYALGDVTGKALFTHVGKYQARVAAANVAGRERTADYRA